MADTLPPPPVPPEADLRDFPYTPIYRERLFGSHFHAHATDAEWRAAVTLWLKCQDQSPAGSLPKDDIELCRLAEFARDMKSWKKVKAMALYGWYECSDGRLYHKVCSLTAAEQWQSKVSHGRQTLQARIAKAEKRLSAETEGARRTEIHRQITDMKAKLAALSPGSTSDDSPVGGGGESGAAPAASPVTGAATGSVTDIVSGPDAGLETGLNSNYKGNGKGNGNTNHPIEETQASPSLGKTGSTRGSRIDPKWTLSDPLWAWSTDEAGAMPALIRVEEAKFRDFWAGKAGAGGVKLDWDATWRNWLRRAMEDQHGRRNGAANPQRSYLAGVAEFARDIGGGEDAPREHQKLP